MSRWGTCWAVLLLVLLFGSADLFGGEKRAAKPNVLFIAIDDLNDWVGCLQGHPQTKTPHIDRLAKRGMLFANAHCQAPLCNSSRTSILTGLRPSTTGVYALQPWFRTSAKLSDHVTLPQHFAANGYRTMTTGKIYHGGYPPAKQRPNEFQVWGPRSGVGARPKKKLVTTPGGNHPLVDWGTFPHADQDKGDWKVASWAVEQLTNPSEQPTFLAVGFFLPHVPCYATQKWFDIHPLEKLMLPPYLATDREDVPEFSWYLYWNLPEPRLSWFRREKQWRPFVQSYLASISFVDSQVGRVLDALEKSGKSDNTIVVLWSDHGFHLGEKDISGKNTLWERSARVPLIFAGPGIQRGVCQRPAELLDMYPTLSELCQLPQPKRVEGHSLVPQLKDPSAERNWPAITTHNPGNHGVRSERYRYIRYADGSEELYDMKKDPNEWENLAKKNEFADVVKEHARWLPKNDAEPLPNSRSRLLIRKGDTWYWENKPIDPADAVR